MTKQPTYVTREGLKKLEDELNFLCTVKRAEIAQRLHEAMEEGDIDENAEYDDAKNQQAFVEGRILALEAMLRNAVIIEDGQRGRDHIALGSVVTIQEVGDGTEVEQYTVVGSAEADPRHGRISNESPLGRALMGKQLEDHVTIDTPSGKLTFKVVEIK
jgi:transcription elongation factor GreA